MKNVLKNLLGVFRLYNKLDNNEKIIKEIHNAQLFNSTISDSKWLLNKGFSPGRWAVGYIFLYVLYRILDETRPKRIIEFGIGQSTKMLNQFSDFNNEARIISFEHDLEWIDFFSRTVIPSGNLEIRKVDLVASEYKGFKSMVYDMSSINDEKFDLILLDGPYGAKRFSRNHIMKLIPGNIDSNNFCILMDDYDRLGEKETAMDIFSVLDSTSIKYYTRIYSGKKDICIICSENNKFLTSL